MAEEGEDQVDDKSEDGEGEGEDGEVQTKGKKKLVIIIAVILLLGGVGAGLFFGGVIGGGGDATEEASDEHGDEHGDEQVEVQLDEDGNPIVAGPVYHELPEFLVNLSTTGKKVSFLKMKVILEFESEAIKATAMTKEPRILDTMNTYLRELRQSDLQGSAGLYRLREEMLMRVNKVIEPNKVTDILFREFLTQ